MAISILAKYKSIRKEKLSDTARDVLDKMAEATNNFKDYTATKKLRPKFEAFYDKIKASKPEALKGYKAPKAAASKKAEPKKRLNRFKAALERRKSQGGVPKVMDDVKIDAKRPAISIKGKRISKNGKTYYEYRDNRYDARPQKYPKLADGGQLPIEDSKLVGKKITIKLPNEPEAIHDTVTMEYNDFVVGKKGVWSKENIVTKHEHGGYMADGGMMAKGGHLGEPHKLDEFENGGEIAEQNTQMLMSLNHQIEHHAREIGEILNDETPVMAWVLAKAERAASDLSDIAHFLDGQSVSDAE